MNNHPVRYQTTTKLRFIAVAGALALAVGAAMAGDLIQPPIRINSGGPAIEGWMSDKGFADGGEAFSFNGQHNTADLHQPAPAVVYNTVRHRDHRYHFALGPGTYRIRLHFTDEFPSTARTMDFVANGTKIIDDFAPYLAAGSRTHHAHILEAVVEVTDEKGLTINCSEDLGKDVFECGIEILAANATDKPTTSPVNKPSHLGAPFCGIDVPAIREFAGTDVRLVWIQAKRAKHYTTEANDVRLVLLDTAVHREPHHLLGGQLGSWSKPIFAPDGKSIVYSDRRSKHAFWLSLDPSEGTPVDLGKGLASDIWTDPETSIVWVYLRSGDGTQSQPIVRRQLQNPSVEEPVWSGSKTGHKGVPWFQLSADGNRAAGAFPWPKCGVINLDRGAQATEWTRYSNGCWSAMIPDNSYRSWHFNGSHTDLSFYDGSPSKKRVIKMGPLPGRVGSQKIYHPQQSNHVSFLTATGPENDDQCDLFLGRFDSEFQRIEGWVQITNDRHADIFGDAWIDPSGKSPAIMAARFATPTSGEDVAATSKSNAPTVSPNQVFAWDRIDARNEAMGADGKLVGCSGKLHSAAVPDVFNGLDLTSGWFTADAESAARVATACRATGEFSIEAIVTSSGGEQTGPARIVSSSSGASERNFTLGEDKGNLVIRIRTTATDPNGAERQITIGPIRPWQPTHVMVSFRPGELVAWMNGAETHRSAGPGGNLSVWNEAFPLILGDEVGGKRNWSGRLKDVRIANKAIDQGAAMARIEAANHRLAELKPTPAAGIRARLIERTPTPKIEEIQPYRRGLVEDVYEITDPRGSSLSGTIVVISWAILDESPVSRNATIGQTADLLLVPWDTVPGLASENRSSSHSEFGADAFYDLRTPSRPE